MLFAFCSYAFSKGSYCYIVKQTTSISSLNIHTVQFRLCCLQEAVCSSTQYECVKNIMISNTDCLPPCSGLILTSFTSTKKDGKLETLFSKEVARYRKYTKWTQFPAGLKG